MTAWPMRLALAGLLGGSGGWLFSLVGIPLPWMLGSITATVVAALAGLPLSVPLHFRTLFVSILGLMLGSAFTPDVLNKALLWTGSIAGLVVFIAVATSIGYWVLSRSGRFDPVTAFFAGTPGGLGEMVLLSASYGGDERAVSLIHSMRILISVAVIPLAFQAFAGYQPQPSPGLSDGWAIDSLDGGVLFLIALAGFLAARSLKVPAAALVGPMVLSAGVHLAGWTNAEPPQHLVAMAQVVLGASIGSRFVGVSLQRVTGILGGGLGLTIVLLALAAGFAAVLSPLTGLPFAALLLAFSPGGLVEMCLVSLAMGIDVAFVSVHHLARIAIVVILAPVVFRFFRRSGGA